MKRTNNSNATQTTGATVGYEAELWRMVDALRGSMDAADYKHVVLGLIFLKYISDAFEGQRQRLAQEPYADPEDPDEYRAANVFWVPPEARWERLRQSTIGQIVDEAMEAVERDNPSLKGVLPKDYVRPALDRARLGQLIDFITNIRVGNADARKMGRMVDRIHRELTDEEIQKIARTYHAWLGEAEAGEYQDIPGFCKSATLGEIRKHGYVLTPDRYVGAEVKDDDDELFEEKMARLVAQRREQ